MLLFHFAATLALSIGLGLYLTPIIRNGALRFGVLDKPDGRLKHQAEPVPYLGGVAVYLAFLITLGLVFDFRDQLLGLLLGGTIIAMVGLFDDMKVLPPGVKVVGQLIAALVLVRSHVAIELEFLPAWVSPILSIAWLVGVSNALNLVDVSDALATGCSVIAAMALFFFAVVAGDLLIATTTLALVGALVGFLRFNLPPARIYLGDTGSLFIGFQLAALAMIGKYTALNSVAALAPLAILIVPIFETCFVSVTRLARGRSPFMGSPDHFAVRLRAHGWSARRIAFTTYAFAAAGAASGIGMMLSQARGAAAIAAGVVASAAIVAVVLWRRYPPPARN